MERPIKNLYTADQCRVLDRTAIDDHGMGSFELLERAGQAAYNLLRARWPQAQKIVVYCGSGNNGGDGYILAREAALDSKQVRVVAVTEARSVDATKAAQQCVDCMVPIEPLPERTLDADVIVDGLLGTGISGTVKEPYASAISLINRCDAHVFALDLPSGLNADTGAGLGECIKADVTITFIGAKLGLFTGQGKGFSGQVILDDLDVPPVIYESIAPTAALISTGDGVCYAGRQADFHKGKSGRLLIIGGAPSMSGAVVMAGQAALRVGAGLVRIATHRDHASEVAMARPELIVHPVGKPEALKKLMEDCDVIAIGPGLGQNAWAKGLLNVVIKANKPKVLDADALNLLAGKRNRSDAWILTPHPGEAARLLKTTPEEVQNNRPEAAREIARRHGGVAVLKGAGTLVFDEATGLSIVGAGNPGMATAGMGDVLTGVIAGLLGQNLGQHSRPDIGAAARAGTWLHSAAADDAANADGMIGLMATDLMPFLRQRRNSISHTG